MVASLSSKINKLNGLFKHNITNNIGINASIWVVSVKLRYVRESFYFPAPSAYAAIVFND